MKKSNLKNINLKSLRMKGLSGGKRFGPPPLKGPNPIVPPVKFGLGGMMSNLIRQVLGKNTNQESTNNTFRDFYVLNKEGQSEKLNVTPYKPATMKNGGIGCPYRRGGKTDIQGISKIQLKGKKFIGVK